jgi:predicted CoA-binding protein
MHRDTHTESEIHDLLTTTKTIAIVGASPKPDRPVYGVMAYLQRAGYRCIPVNPGQAGKEILGERVVARLADIVEPIDIVDIFRQRFALGGAVDEALALPVKPKAVWMQLDLWDEAAAAKAEAAGVMAVMDRCTKIEHARLR